MEEEQRRGGQRERSRPSKAAFTAPEEEPAAAPAPRRAPVKRPAPSVLFQAPPVPDEATGEPPWDFRPVKRATPGKVAEEAPRRRRAAGQAAPDEPAGEAPPRQRATGRARGRQAADEDSGDEPKGAKKVAAGKARKAAKTAATTAPAQKAVALVEGSDVARTSAEDGPATRVRFLDRPGHAPELLALAAIRAIGPQARDWVARTRATYPAATSDGLARLATRRFVRMAGAGGAVSAAFGLLTPVAELTATAWAQAALVLHLAAGYGHDPLDQARAVDLLVLVGVHPSAEVARAALAEATAAEPEVGRASALRAAEAAWRLAMPLSNRSRGWVALRMVARRLPGVVPVTAALGAASSVERLAYRARAHYRAG